MEQTNVAKQWAGRGFSCAIWTDPPGRVWADFVHDVDEIVMLIDGKSRCYFGGERSTLSQAKRF